MRPVRVDTRPVSSAHASCDGLERGPAGNGIVLARLVRPLLSRRSVEGTGTAFLVDAEGHDLRGDRRDRCGGHHVAAGAAWGRTRLGLTLMLGAGGHLYTHGAGVLRVA